MNKYFIYLTAELRKLGNEGDAKNFLSHVKIDDLDSFDFPSSSGELNTKFASQHAVQKYLDNQSMSRHEQLTKLLDESWRQNGVYRILKRHSKWEQGNIPINVVYLKRAEPNLRHIFKRNYFKLLDISRDPKLLKYPPYCYYSKGQEVEYEICLAEKMRESKYVIFDGVHRAIQLALNDEKYINMYYATDWNT